MWSPVYFKITFDTSYFQGSLELNASKTCLGWVRVAFIVQSTKLVSANMNFMAICEIYGPRKLPAIIMVCSLKLCQSKYRPSTITGLDWTGLDWTEKSNERFPCTLSSFWGG